MKEINSELIYHKKYIVTKKHSTQKKFPMLLFESNTSAKDTD